MANELAKTELSTQEKILEAAGALFLERGYDKVGVREITEAAGVNVASVNYHFGGKQNLYREFVRRRLQDKAHQKVKALQDIIQRRDVPDLREAIRHYVSTFFSDVMATAEDTRFMELLSNEMSENSIAVDIFYEEAVAPLHQVMKTAILKARPDMSPERASLCIASIGGQVFHFIRAREFIKRNVGREYTRKFVDELVEHITEFSLRGLG
jgi:AcrR family transcriptional regulator